MKTQPAAVILNTFGCFVWMVFCAILYFILIDLITIIETEHFSCGRWFWASADVLKHAGWFLIFPEALISITDRRTSIFIIFNRTKQCWRNKSETSFAEDKKRPFHHMKYWGNTMLFWISEKSNRPFCLSLLSLWSSACSHRQTSPRVLFGAKPRKCFSQHCTEDVLWEVLAPTIWQEWGLSVWGPHSWQWKYDVVSRCIWARTSLPLSLWSVVKPCYPTESFILQSSLWLHHFYFLSFSDTVQPLTGKCTLSIRRRKS